MATNLQTPILNNLTRSVNFFNGRLLTGEDLTAEQQTNRAAHNMLGQAIGSGVVYGLEVSQSVKLSSPQTPVLTVTKGLAINRGGAQLLLAADTDVSLIRPAGNGTTAATTIFQECTPAQSGVYVGAMGVYLLTVGPASAPQGLAEVSGISTATASCNSNYNACGVQFRLLQIDQAMDLTPTQLADANHLQNLVAYNCFGLSGLDQLLIDPFVPAATGYGLIDKLRSARLLTDCEVPLATLSWTAGAGLVFIDMWSVRRPLAENTVDPNWPLFVGTRRFAESEAMFLEFQDELSQIIATQPNTDTINATQFFNYLPPVGILPAAGATASPGFTYQAFFPPLTYHDPIFLGVSRLEALFRQAMSYRPVNLQNSESVWVYQIVNGTTILPYIVFASIDVPFLGQPQFDVTSWNFGTFV